MRQGGARCVAMGFMGAMWAVYKRSRARALRWGGARAPRGERTGTLGGGGKRSRGLAAANRAQRRRVGCGGD